MEGEATGYFGAITTQAVKKFQRSAGIPETGYIGQLTRKAINDILSGE
jgi:peptidoglycan hydrolase-like protein with peptidoglycan-binding domain